MNRTMNALVVGVAALTLVGSGVGLGQAVRPEKTPAACIEAMDKSAQVLELSKQMPATAEKALRDLSLRSSYLAGEGVDRLTELKDRMEKVQAEAEAAMAQCRDAG